MPNPESAIRNRKSESRRPGLNRRPAVYETAALPTELRRRERANIASTGARHKRTGSAASPREGSMDTAIVVKQTFRRFRAVLFARVSELAPLQSARSARGMAQS
jgi:hypothetical protein